MEKIRKWKVKKMHIHSESIEPSIDNNICADITSFLKRKRKTIIEVLSENESLTHGELARAINSSSPSLSNMLIKFDEFDHRLIEIKNQGKYTYYSLTDLARAYVEKEYANAKKGNQGEILRHDELLLFQETKNSLRQFQNEFREDWEIEFDNELLRRIEWRPGIFGSFTNKSVNQFLSGIQFMIIKQYDSSYQKTLKLLDNNILERRLTKFSDICYPFANLLRLLQTTEDTYEVYDMLDSILWRKCSIHTQITQNFKWTREYQLLYEAIDKAITLTKNTDKGEIYHYFMVYIPANKELCAHLASCIWEIQQYGG